MMERPATGAAWRMPPACGSVDCSPAQSAYRSTVAVVILPYSDSPVLYSTPEPSAARFQPWNTKPFFVQPSGRPMAFMSRLFDAHTRLTVSSVPPSLEWKTTVMTGGVGAHCAYRVPTAFSWVSRSATVCLSVNDLPVPSGRVFQPVRL